jgi:hypothetical protein
MNGSENVNFAKIVSSLWLPLLFSISFPIRYSSFSAIYCELLKASSGKPQRTPACIWSYLLVLENDEECTDFAKKKKKKTKSRHKILGTRRETWSKFYTEVPQILGATLQIVVARSPWLLGFLQPWLKAPLSETGTFQ